VAHVLVTKYADHAPLYRLTLLPDSGPVGSSVMRR
jgi:hypothetical protein